MVKDLVFVVNKCPVGIILFNRKMEIIDRNKKASAFLTRFELPEEIISVSRRLFDAAGKGKVSELFPGEIYITKKLDGSASNWVFRLYIQEKTNPLICLLIFEETVSNKVDMNLIRKHLKLTRRETDILRRVLDGLTNSEIAIDLDISEQTVKDHLSNVYMKTGAKNRFALLQLIIDRPDINS
jgi:DNA-binding CsgD family transcriptional regulator